MKMFCSTRCWLLAGFSLWSAVASAAPEPVLTVQVGAPAPPPTPLVNHTDDWRYRKGTSEPQIDWKTAADINLDGTWLSGPGGFGYDDGDDATVLPDMLNGYNTVYIRQTFEIPADTDPTRRLRLVMDWDDGFVAYLDGAEVQRSPNVAVADPLFNSATVAGQNHEASAGAGGSPPTTYDLGPVSNFGTGTHVLAIHGLNAAPNSSDFSLIADLRLEGGAAVAGGGPLFAIVNSATTPLSGTNTIPGSSRVTVNGEVAAFNPATGEWSRNHTLAPGLNSLFIAAHDGAGAILASINRDVLRETAIIPVGGTLASDTVWDGTNGTYHVTTPLIVPAGVHLLVTNGAVVLLAPSAFIRGQGPDAVLAIGTESSPILFAPSDGATPWGALDTIGANATMLLKHCEVVAGQISPRAGSTVTIEDCVIRDDTAPGREVIAADNAESLVMLRTHGLRFAEMDASQTPVMIKDCLLEHFALDGLDIKGTNVMLAVMNTTLRFGNITNGNADGLDFGPGAGFVDRCLIHDFPDKGISLGGAPGTQMQETLIYNCGSGINVNNSTNCFIRNVTISSCATGLFFRTSGANLSDLSGTNNIIWGNGENVIFTGNSSLQLAYSDVQGGQPGEGNINIDPFFVDEGAKDFRLSPGSPAIGTGFGGANMGAIFPVGGLPAAPRQLAARVTGTSQIELSWQDDSENETGVQLERRAGPAGAWEIHALFGPNVTSYTDVSAIVDQRYYYRLRAINGSGKSRFSNIASAIREEPNILVGGTLATDATWSPALGTVTVISSLIVPSGVTLTVLPGTVVKVTNNASIIAAGGGTINIAGTAENKVMLMPLNGTNLWGQLSAQFAGSSLTVRHADIGYAQVSIYSNAVGLLEDTFIHDYRRAGALILVAPIVLTHFAAPTTIRRCHIREYHETLFRNGVLTIEECLFEYIHGDGLDFDGVQPGTVLRSCTFRHGQFGNVDAVDVGPGDMPGSFNVRIENCMMYDFPFDKGVSVGDNNSSRGTIVSNCFVYSCLSGVMAKDLCDVSVRNCTIVGNNWGFTNYNKVNPASPTGGGILTNCYNNILWGNGITISMVNDSRLYADHNDFGNTNWPGEGNFDLDPLFVNPSGRDYRLTPNSPCIETGRDGADMGAQFPVGAPMVLSHPRIEQIDAGNGNAVVRFWADNEKTYSLLCSPVVEGGTWTKLADVPLGSVPRYLSVTNALAPDNRFYRLVTPAQP